MDRKLALLIANSTYDDTTLTKLVTPEADVNTLARVLRDPDVGGFDEVEVLKNEPTRTIMMAIERFFAEKKRDELLLLYFSGHGVLDGRKRLYLASRDTIHTSLSATAIPDAFINDSMKESRPKQKVLILDCCYSGAFARGAKSSVRRSVDTVNRFNGRGRIILTATDATQYAWEGDQIIGEAQTSVFTRYLIQGLATGEADSDGDGWVTLDEWYRYVHEQVTSETDKQTPGIWADQQGSIRIAKKPSLRVAVSIHQPDLSLLIRKETNQMTYTFHLSSETTKFELKPFGSIHLELDARQHFQRVIESVARSIRLSQKTGRNKEYAKQELADAGIYLFELLFPENLKALLWSLRDSIQSVQVQSEESWIPWELCKLEGGENDQSIEGPFLCEAFALTRWLPDIAIKPHYYLNKMAVVIPTGLPLENLPRERNYLLSLNSAARQVTAISANRIDIRKALISGQYNHWYFSTHGSYDPSNYPELHMALDGNEHLTPQDITGAVMTKFGSNQPFVFLNVGAANYWMTQFLHAGASAFIGPYASISDASAYEFMKALYDHLLIGMPIGRAAQEARIALKSTGDFTGLFYTIYADVLATLQEETSPITN